MARCLYLHIGTPKSATTYLQSLCDVSGRTFSDAQFLIPAENRYAILRDFLGKQKTPSDAGAWERLTAGLADHEGDALFSHEMLVALSPGQIERFVHGIRHERVHIIVTARDLTRVVPSQWQTMVKNGSTATWTDFARTVCAPPPATGQDGWPTPSDGSTDEIHRRFWLKHDLPAIITRWSSLPSPSQLTLVTVPPGSVDADELARRFSHVIDLDLVPHAAEVAEANTSMGAVSAELMRRLNVDLAGASRTARRTAFRDTLGKGILSQRADAEPSIGLEEPQLRALHEVAARMVSELSGSGVVVEGDVAELLPSGGTTVVGVDPGSVTESELLAAAAAGLQGMIRAYGDLADTRPGHPPTTPAT
jgi:hypothetical protein